jgi:uncharacterized protein YndB with AHSA1/START domain
MTAPDHATIAHRTVSSSIVVAAPPAQVFALLADPHRHHEFDGSGTVRAAVSGPEQLALGDRFGMAMKMKIGYHITNEVVEFEQDRLIAWCHFAKARWRYELAPVEIGTAAGTRITETFDYARAPMRRGIALLKMPQQNAKSIRDTLRKLQEIFGAA